jgi:hypothetical protein
MKNIAGASILASVAAVRQPLVGWNGKHYRRSGSTKGQATDNTGRKVYGFEKYQ